MDSQTGKTGTDPGPIAVVYGSAPEQMIPALLDHLRPDRWLSRDGAIGLKPNLVLPSPASMGATTDPRIVEALVHWLRDHGFDDLLVLEGAWLGADTQEAFEVCGYRALADRLGLELVDLKRDRSRPVRVGSWAVDVCERALSLAGLINLPVLKAHCQTGLTCALKNLKGCIPDREKRRFHAEGLHGPIARLNRALPVSLVIVDGLRGDLTFEEGGTPVAMNRLFAGRDPVAIDAYAAALLGFAPGEIDYIDQAASLGVGLSSIDPDRIDELNQGQCSGEPPDVPAALERLVRGRVLADRACSACYGPLIHALQRLADRAELSRLSWSISVGQGFVDRSGPGPGVGDCTASMDVNCPGCPPTARRMLEFFEDLLV
jgi:uncharacterized protein (DUF362 family)